MATLTSEQLKDSYQSLVTIGDSITSNPTSGVLENGLGNPITDITIGGDITIADKIIHSGDTNTAIRFPSADTVTIETAGSERMRIDSSGRVDISGAINNSVTFDRQLQTRGALISGITGTATAQLYLHRDDLTVNANDIIGELNFSAADGGSYVGAAIKGIAANSWGGSNSPTHLSFQTANTALSSPTERMRIDSSGNVGIGTDSPAFNNGGGLHIHAGITTNLHLTSTATGSTATDGSELLVGSDSNLYVRNRENAETVFLTNNTERMRILSSGGITFNGDTATANALDDYEEGTWSPDWDFETSGGVGISVSSATYTKIGRMVTINARIFTTSTSSPSGKATITGLPFTSNSSILDVPINIGELYRWGTNIKNIKAVIPSNSSFIDFVSNDANNSSSEGLNGSDFDTAVGNKNVISVSATYFV